MERNNNPDSLGVRMNWRLLVGIVVYLGTWFGNSGDWETSLQFAGGVYLLATVAHYAMQIVLWLFRQLEEAMSK